MKKKKSSSYLRIAIPLILFMSLAFLILASPKLAKTNTEKQNNQTVMVVGGSNSQWSHMSQLDIFASLEETENGKILHPQSSGSYTFYIANTYTNPISYILDITDENIAKIPIVFRLKSNGEYIYGSDSEWVSINSFDLVEGGIQSKARQEFIIDWKWEGNNDAIDTASGIMAQDGISYILNVNVTTERWDAKQAQ